MKPRNNTSIWNVFVDSFAFSEKQGNIYEEQLVERDS